MITPRRMVWYRTHLVNPMSILVFGSLNMDMVTRSPRLPQAGETLIGTRVETIPGGKGANQAVAAARLGASVRLVGRVGADDVGQTLLTALRRSQVDCQGVYVDAAAQTGMAMITVDDRGENTIIVVPGANHQVNTADLARFRELLPHHRLVLLQLELPLPAVCQAAQWASAAGLTVVLDPAPAVADLPDELYQAVSILTPNQLEAQQLTGIEVTDPDRAAQAGRHLRQRGCETVIVKLGAGGVVVCTADQVVHLAAYPVSAVDTVAAGDAFNGGLAVALSQGRSLRDAGQYASAVAALSVTRPGAQSSLPTQADVAAFQDRVNNPESTGHDVAQ